VPVLKCPFETFCTFVRDWSDRESHLALSPMAIFEHAGRRPPASVAEVEQTIAQLQQLLGLIEKSAGNGDFRRAMLKRTRPETAPTLAFRAKKIPTG